MDDTTTRETLAALDKALARIALSVAGTSGEAAAVLDSLGRGELTPASSAFLSEAAALMRARVLLAGTVPQRPRFSLRKFA